jgi:hypothetical protein
MHLVIIKLDNEQKKNIPEVKMHVHLDPAVVIVYVVVMNLEVMCKHQKLTFACDLQKRKEQKKTYLRLRCICILAPTVIIMHVIVMDLLRCVGFDMSR